MSRPLTQGEALGRFQVSAAKAERFAEFYTGEGADPASHDSFCRQVFRRSHAERAVDPAQALPCEEVAVADENGWFDFSAFSPLPFHVQRWLSVDLIAPHDGEYAFRLGTCGGVRVWSSGRLMACFTPFTRNVMQFQDVRLSLCQGKNHVLIHLDELFERDTLCGLKMVYLDETPLGTVACEGLQQQRIPVPSASDPEHLLMLMAQKEYGPEADALLAHLLKRVSAREEGSVYCLLALLQLWHDYRNTDFPPPLWRRVKSSILGYRYGHDERGCDVMDFSNHASAFRCAQSLAGQLFPDELFIASSRVGHQQKALAEGRMKGAKS
jgi:hypothetical protein